MLIQKSIIDAMDDSTKVAVHQAFATLSITGVWEAHIQLAQQLMLQGSETEDPAALAARILEGRKRVNLFKELQMLGLEQPTN